MMLLESTIETLAVDLFKRLGYEYIYAPDMQVLATETVLKQAELMASELTIS